MPPLDWDSPIEIAMALYEAYPEQDPLKVRFTDLRKWVSEIDGFTGDPAKSNEGRLEAIQMAWTKSGKTTRNSVKL
jgi:FeS assembly protein IscX